jgi:hypothetical protein
MDFTKLAQTATTLDKLPGTRRQPKAKPIHQERKTREGRQRLRAAGDTSRHTHDMSTAPFVALDGEGITYDESLPQAYVLFGASTGRYILQANQRGLSSADCFNFMLRLRIDNPDAIFVGFSIGYDAEMMMRDFTHEQLAAIHKHQVVRVTLDGHKYTVRYIPKKWFMVTAEINHKKVTCRIFDVWSFFASSFVRALEEHVPGIPQADLEHIREGKNLRKNFTDAQVREVMIPYWQLELKYTVQLMQRFRSLLQEADIYPRSWHGPAALANYLNTKHGTKHHMAFDQDSRLLDALQFAFAAGHMERFKTGRANCKVYKYDKRSAYPSAMVRCPSLAGKQWQRRDFDGNWRLFPNDLQDYALYRTRYSARNPVDFKRPEPLFRRSIQATITFPYDTYGWYWGVEVKEAMRTGEVQIYEGYEFDLTDAEWPFRWMAQDFEKRMAWKKAGIAAQIGIKLGMNSMFGKAAQKSGWHKKGDKIPSWHQYEWAGFITSDTRADMHRVAMLAYEKGGLIGIETDAILTTCKMPELIDNGQLGDWEYEEYEDIIYLQTGMYFLKTAYTEYTEKLENAGYVQDKDGGIWSAKFRGLDKKSLTIDRTIAFLESTRYDIIGEPVYRTVIDGLTCTRFIGSKGALHSLTMSDWRKWITSPREIHPLWDTKRVHDRAFCSLCRNGKVYGSQGLHEMIHRPNTNGGNGCDSFASKLPWREVVGQASQWDELDINEEPSFTP